MRYRMISAALLALFSSHALAYENAKSKLYPSPDMYRPNVNDVVVNGSGTSRSMLTVLSELPATISSIGGVCDGSSLIDTFWTALASDPRTTVIPSGANCRVASNMTWPKGKIIRVEGSGRITPDAGVTITNRAKFDAPLRQVFFGAGTIVGMKENRPEWWGAKNTFGWTPGRDDAPAFNLAMASAKASWAGDGTPSDGERPSIRFNGTYYACSQIDLYPSQTTNLGFYGAGSLNGGGTIRPCPTFDTAGGTKPALVAIHGSATAGNAFTGTDIDFRDFNLSNTAGSGAQIGMSWVPEGAGYALYGGLQPGLVENVAITGFPTNLKVQNTRLVKFERLGLWGPNTTRGLWLTVSDNQSFTGDLEFQDMLISLCGSSTENTLCAGITNIAMTADGSVGAGSPNGAQIKGIRFQANLANAEKAFDVQAKNGANIGDHWLKQGSQIDGFACNTINLSAGNDNGNTSGSLIDDWHIVGTYNRGRNAGCQAINAAATGSSKIRNLFITNNWFANPADTVGNFFNVQGLQLNDNTIYDPIGALNAVVFSLSAVTDFQANSNILTRSTSSTTTSTYVNMINVGSGSDYGSASLNVCNGVTISCVAQNGGSNVTYTGNISSSH